MIACWECRNLVEFVQVSERGDARSVSMSPKGAVPSTWTGPDDRAPGVYCGRCGLSVEADLAEVGLIDDRIDFVAPGEFEAGPITREIQALRPDADWYELELPPRPAAFGQIAGTLHPVVADALERTGRRQLFTHQAAAIDAALGGANVIQATSAGSGKSLGFTVPVMDRLVRDPSATALLLFPLRALANDQLDSLSSLGLNPNPWVNDTLLNLDLGGGTSPIGVGRHDGATAVHERTEIRRSARIVISNPDSLHWAILQFATHSYKDKTSWRTFFQGLQYVVIDEVHAYQGVFGSNVGNVLRRLRRIAAHYGATPQFLAASATIGNPIELVTKLTGLDDFVLVDNDGSERRRRTVLVCNPPPRTDDHGDDHSDDDEDDDSKAAEAPAVPDADLGRVAPQTVAIEIAAAAALASPLHDPVRTIGFCRSRNEVFGLTKRLQSRLKDLKRADLGDAVAPYAATFLARDRVEAEGKLRDGSTLAVISTNALELGINIPDLSIALLVGYPGQISSFRQRAGRVGRAGEGVVVLIVGDDPLQQFIAGDAETLQGLLDGRPEEVVINPAAPQIAQRYGLGPAQEELGGIAFEDADYFGPIVDEMLAGASGPPDAEHHGRQYWRLPLPDDPYTDLRGTGSGRSYTVIAQKGRDREPVGVIGADAAPRDCFVPAIWFGPEGDLFRVIGFDQEVGEIYCDGPVDVPYLTRGVPVDRVGIVADHAEPAILHGAVLGYGALEITRQVHSYKELPFSGNERSKQVERGWPPHTFNTVGLHLTLPPTWLDAVAGDPEETIRAVEHLLLSLAPTVVACDPYDLEASSDGTTIYVYDSFGGDLGLSRPAFDRFAEVARYAVETVERCACESGCPSCVMLARRPDGNRDLSKLGAVSILRHLVGEE